MKDQVSSLVHFFNNRELDRAFLLIHPDVVMTTFSVKTGKQAIIKGKQQYIDAVRNNFRDTSDLKMVVDNVISDGIKASISGYYTGTVWELLRLENPFKVRFSAFFEFADGLICKHDKYLDTLHLLLLSGNSVFHENIPHEIDKYLETLSELGLIK